ncbi:MAG: hypothetical protein ACLR23_27175 [Clostridia bacterium]
MTSWCPQPLVGRMSARHVGKPAANRVEAYLDEQFPDERLHEIYPSMKFVDTTKCRNPHQKSLNG